MHAHVNDALASGAHRMAAPASTSVLLIGAIGPLGNAVLQVLPSSSRRVLLAVRGSLQVTFDGITPVSLQDASADIAVVVFDHSRAADGREAAIARCAPAELLALAMQLRERGTKALLVVTPHKEASLPQALRAGLLDLNEQALAAMGFEHLLLIRPAQQAANSSAPQAPLQRVANALLGTLRMMVPQQEQPVLTRKVAAFVECALRALPQAAPGTYIAGADTLWHSAQQPSPFNAVQRWLRIAPEQETTQRGAPLAMRSR
jgi:hypothetical protein